MDKQALEKEILECIANNRYKGNVIVTIPTGMDRKDAMYLLGNRRVTLLYRPIPEEVVIHDGKYMIYGLKQKLKEDLEYRQLFIEMSLKDQNNVSKIRILI